MANEYLQRTPTSCGNRHVHTVSVWAKVGSSNTIKYRTFFAAGSSFPNARSEYGIDSNGKYNMGINDDGSTWHQAVTTAFARDGGNWIHFCVSVNSTLPLERDRIRFWINGSIYPYAVASPLNINANTPINDVVGQYIGKYVDASQYWDGELSDFFLVDGQALTPDVFGFYKEGKGYQSSGTTKATDFRPGQWVPHSPRTIKNAINRTGGFGVNGFYLPMNDSSNFGADFHCAPNSIIKLKGEDLPQPRNGAPTTSDAYVSQLRSDPYAANLVLAVPGISISTSANLVTNGTFETVVDGETGYDNGDGTVDGWNKNSIGSLSITSGTTGRALRVSQPSATAGVTYGQGSISLGTLTSGKRYLLKYSGLGGTAKKYPAICTNANTSNTDGSFLGLVAQIGAYSTAAEEVQKYFEPSSTAEHWLVLQLGNDGAGTYHDFDNIVVIQEDAPRDYSADIKGSGTNKTLTAVGKAGVGYEIPSYYGSAMQFGNDGTNGAGNTDIINVPTSSDFVFNGDVTIECWIYPKGTPSTAGAFLGQWQSSGGTNRNIMMYLDTSNRVTSYFNSSATNYDTGASPALGLNQWHHIVTEKDGSNFRLYLNGVCVGINTNTPTAGNTAAVPFTIGAETESGGTTTGADYGIDGYIQDVRVYKGVAKYKGGFDVPKPYTPVGIESWRSVPDCTANNFCTMNPLIGATQRSGSIESTIVTYTDGNLTTKNNASAGWAPQMQSHSNFGMTTGKWYWECSNFSTTTNEIFGISKGNEQGSPTGSGTGIESLISYQSSNGNIYIASQSDNSGFINPATGTISDSPGTALSSTSDVVGFAFDADNSSMTVYLNGTLNNTVTNIVSTARSVNKPWRVTKAANSSGTGSGMSWNFGQNPTFSGTTTAGTYTDGNGKGLFKYQPPSGFLALCEDNLPTPAIADPGEYFKTVLYTGDGSSRSITGIDFKPDFVWLKSRDSAFSNFLFDSVRGATKNLFSNQDIAEASATNRVLSFDSDGFSLGNAGGSVNGSGENIVAWCWKAGGAAVSNNDGSIASQISVNQDAGFSIVSWTGNNIAGASVGHGLGKEPSMIILKSRGPTARSWGVYHKSIGNTGLVYLDLTNSTNTATFHWNDTSPTSSVFTLGNGSVTGSAEDYIGYCWTEIEGFSKFGIYSTNSSTDGPFVYLGFKPAFLLVKPTYTSNWIIMDSSRGPTNPDLGWLYPDLNSPEESGSTRYCDFLSNGFKVRNGGTGMNDGGSVIYAAFAESPFQTANAK